MSANVADLSQASVTADSTVELSNFQTASADVLFTAAAHNPGAVQNLRLAWAEQGVASPANDYVEVVGTRSGNTGPDLLNVLGNDGQHGQGPQAILSTFGQQDYGHIVTLTATATNFNGQSSKVVATYRVHQPTPPPPPPPSISSFTASPDYINLGQTSRLSWSIANCGANCNVSINDTAFSITCFVAQHLPASGSLNVKPCDNTVYHLTATNPQGSANADKAVNVYNGGGGGCSGCQAFYFKITSGSVVTPCYTTEVFAPDEPTAQQIALSQAGSGYTATPIDASTFNSGNGCP